MPAVKLHHATAADNAVLSALGRKLFRQAYADQVDASQIERHVAVAFSPRQQAAELADPAVTTVLVEMDGSAAGYMQLRRTPIPLSPGPRAAIELWRIYLDQQLHGHGIASRLVRDAFGIVHRENAGGLWLGVWERNLRAMAFYRRHGFRVVGEHVFIVGTERQRDLVMHAALPANAAT